MAIYVTSDAHGHVRALDEALSKISLTSDDTLYVLCLLYTSDAADD